MSSVTTTTGTNHGHPMRDFVARQLENGMDNEAIIGELGKSGIQENAARQLVESVSQDALAGALHPGADSSSIVPAILGGSVAAIICGCIWYGLVVLTHYEFGMVAWGLGAAVGLAVIICSKGERGSTQQTVAVALSIFGVLVGKYLIYGHMVRLWAEQLGRQTAANVSVLSPGMMSDFLSNMGEVFGAFDLFWIGLAVYSAWKITDDVS